MAMSNPWVLSVVKSMGPAQWSSSPARSNRAVVLDQGDVLKLPITALNLESFPHHSILMQDTDCAKRCHCFSASTNPTPIPNQAKVNDQTDGYNQNPSERGQSAEGTCSPAVAESCCGQHQETQHRQDRIRNGEGCEGLQQKDAVEQPHQQQDKRGANMPRGGRHIGWLESRNNRVLVPPISKAYFNGRAHQTGDNPKGMATKHHLWVVMDSESHA